VQELPDTRDSLLLEIREPENREAWEEFVAIYRPVVYRLATTKGLQHADALDLVQTVFITIANSIASWEKANPNARFRYWLLTIAKNATLNALTRRPRDQPLGGESIQPELLYGEMRCDEDRSQIELEYRRQLFLRAAEQVRTSVENSTWQAFELTAVQGMAIEEAASELGKSVGAVYAARSRIMKRLTDVVTELEEAYQ
jgi:RNA polymerase sigma-70 factor (ECF subfamily)